MEKIKKYRLVCYAYYCGWKSAVTEDYAKLDAVMRCPLCGVGRGEELVIEEVDE